MHRRVILVGIIYILGMVSLSGCTDQNTSTEGDMTGDESKLVGTWESEEGLLYTYQSNGDYFVQQTKAGTWSLDNEKLVITYSSGLDFVVDYSFSNNDNTLTLISSSGDATVYAKQ